LRSKSKIKMTMKNKLFQITFLFLIIFLVFSCKKEDSAGLPMIIDHNCTNLSKIPQEWLNKAKTDLHISYGHSSHGNQLLVGMTGLQDWKGEPYLWNNGTLLGSLDIRDGYMGGDLGQNGDLNWEATTRSYLGDWRNADINVIIWSWCGGVSDNTEEGIITYLNAMNQLENDFPSIKFVYMTGHLDGTGIGGNLNIRNEQIRNYCKDHNKILYDFADIESYDPDGNYFLDKAATDSCSYDSDGNGSMDRNWAIDWQNSHTEGVDWFICEPDHTKPLNGNLKAYAAWWLWSRLAGWDGK
jgi:hypothetical protein